MADHESIWADAWTGTGEEPWQGGARTRRVARGAVLAASLYELPPRARGPGYHFHHGNEEMLVVLKGRPTLRMPQGERQLEEGEVVTFRVGPQDAHKCSNDTDEPVRYLMVSNNASPDAVEYPDTGDLSVMAYTASQLGAPLWNMRKIKE